MHPPEGVDGVCVSVISPKQVVRSTQTRRLGLEETPPAWPCTAMLCQACPAVATA